MIIYTVLLMISICGVAAVDGGAYSLEWNRLYLPSNDFHRIDIEQFTNLKYKIEFKGNLNYSVTLTILEEDSPAPGLDPEDLSFINVFELDTPTYIWYIQYKQNLLEAESIQILQRTLCSTKENSRLKRMRVEGRVIVIEERVPINQFSNAEKNLVLDSSSLCLKSDPETPVSVRSVFFSTDLRIELSDMDNQYLRVFYRT